jgi:HSP20 family molecular chaperone IbpA
MSEADDLEEVEERLDRLFSYMTSGMESVLFDKKTRSLRPLYRVVVDDDELRVTFDLPRVQRGGVKFSATASTLTVEAKMGKPVELRLAGHHQTHVKFERYSKKIRLPEKVVPGKATMKLTAGFLTVRLPLLHEERAVGPGRRT